MNSWYCTYNTLDQFFFVNNTSSALYVLLFRQFRYVKMSRRRREKPADVAISMVKQKLDRDGFYMKEIPPKGRGVFAKVSFTKGEFLLQYAGKLIPGDEGDKLEEEESSGFRFFITFKGKDYCIDATEEPEEGPSLGRLVNHGEKKEVNVKLSVIDVDSKPALCLFALTDIAPGQELLYDYGVSNLPWIQQNKV
ncbi:Histone-lysine N-methyltransferase set-1 [Holothuria leucospilota]|uniref:Histone-lysine N-methyltransferase set-1 n=1 Tax=Holothuria leucospilota TaxID=206669 RepID=A0A9Q0Y8P7_HOLLE|nr:Histone-lysine N-methyltransferase set-1 [Holothuria leucospilota]